MHSSEAEMEALCVTHIPKSVSFVDELQLLNKRTKTVPTKTLVSKIAAAGLLTPIINAIYVLVCA